MCGVDGGFSFLDLPAGSFELSARYLGYKEELLSLELDSGEALRLQMELEVEAIPMETLEVLGDRNREERELQTGFVELGAKELLSEERYASVEEAARAVALKALERTREGSRGRGPGRGRR